jgi:hypothetical protein|nr:MAG TPA: hypothetical protein [Caudoviricetes sp.]
MRRSTNLQLKLPDGDDFFNIEDFNENSEIVDRKLTEFNAKIAESAVNSEEIKEELKAQSEQLLNKQKEDISKQMAEAKKELAKAIKDIADSKGASTTTFNADGSITTDNSIETVTTTFNADKSITERHVYKNGTTKTLKTVFEGKTIRTTEVG